MPRKRNEFDLERIEYARYHRTLERQVKPYFRKALRETIEPVILFANTYGLELLNPSALINQLVWNDVYPKVYNVLGVKSARKEYYRQRNAEQAEKADIGFLVDVWTNLLRQFAYRYTYKIRTELNDTTVEIINRALGEVSDLGIDEQGKVRLFERNLKTAMRTRTATISRTESTTISNIGKAIGAQSWIDEQGGGGYKVWLGREDNRERPAHLAENNVVIPIEDLHEVGGELCERPGDINLSAAMRINCRCTESYMSANRYNALVKRGRIKNGKIA